MAKNRVGTRKTPGWKSVATVGQKRGGVQRRVKRIPLSPKQLVDMLELYAESPLSLREIGLRFGVDKSRVLREAQKAGIERGGGADLAARVEAASKAAIAEQRAGESLKDSESVSDQYVRAAAAVLAAQRTDQRLARSALQRLLVRMNEILDSVPDLHEALRALAAAAIAMGDQDVRVKAFQAMDSLNFEPMARTARQLVQSLRDLDAIERIAHGLKVGDDPDGPSAARPRVAVVPAKAPRPRDED